MENELKNQSKNNQDLKIEDATQNNTVSPSEPNQKDEEKSQASINNNLEKTQNQTEKKEQNSKSAENNTNHNFDNISNNQTNLNGLNTLNLKISNVSNFGATIYVDGKVLKYKKDHYGNLTSVYSATKNTVKIEIKKLYDINGPFWFLTSLFFFIISIFGIFDIKPNKRCIGLNTALTVKITQNSSLKIALKSRTQLDKAFETTCENCEILEETGNNYFIDKTAKKRYKIMRILKIISWFLLLSVFALIALKISNVI